MPVVDLAVVDVRLGERSYPVVIEPEGLEGLGEALSARVRSKKLVLITDEIVALLWAVPVEKALRSAGFAHTRIVLPAGERAKHLSTWGECLDSLLRQPIDRTTPVVALGGGVVGDIAGFAAAVALRGLPFVQIPTTVLAMVDSSVGGKTGINHDTGKNRIGAFHQPNLVYAPLCTLATLPIRERRAGLAEVVKTAVLGDADLLLEIERASDTLVSGDPAALASIIARCVAIKADIVSQDERETGIRAFLNLGHTVGHALENAVGYGTLNHGEAVALGMIAEIRWAIRTGVCEDRGLADRLQRLFHKLGLPDSARDADRKRLQTAMLGDKKATNRHVRVPVPVRSGKMRLVEHPLELLTDLLEELP